MGNGNSGVGGVGQGNNGKHLGWKKHHHHHHHGNSAPPLASTTSALTGSQPTSTTTAPNTGQWGSGSPSGSVLQGGGGLSGINMTNSPTGTGVGQSLLTQDGLSGQYLTGALSNNAMGLMEFT